MRSVRKKYWIVLLAGAALLVVAAAVHHSMSGRSGGTDAEDAHLAAGLEFYAKGCAEIANWRKSNERVADFEQAVAHFNKVEAEESQTDYETAQMHLAVIHAFFRREKEKQAYSVIARDILTDLYRASKSERVRDQCVLLLEQIDALDRYYFKSIVDMDGQMEEMVRGMSAFMAGKDRE